MNSPDNQIKCLIADDEHLARQLLQAYTEKIPHLELCAVCENAMEALNVLRTQSIDLLLLDIQMPDLTGLELLRSLKVKPVSILTTAYSEYALEGYELDVIDYLVKPIAFERFVQAINKATDFIQLRKQTPVIVQAPTQTTTDSAPKAGKDHFYVKADYKWVKVRYDEILYIEGMREYVKIHTPDKRHVIYESMKNLENDLPNDRFVRCHKSYIVALDKIDAVYGNTLEVKSHEIPIGKSYKEALFTRIEMK